MFYVLNTIPTLITIVIIANLLTACGQSANNYGAAQAIEAYLTALSDQDPDSLINLSCAAWESNAQIESQAYYVVQTRLDGLACATTETDGEFTVISCEGNIIATYSGEDKPLSLSARQYLSVEEGGEWRMCGYR